MRPKKIILISVDTLRADHLGCYGYKRNTSPFLDAFRKECVLFNRAFSTCSYTVPSHASMFTAKYPSRHSIGFHQKFPKFDSDADISIAEILKTCGHKTAAFVGAVVLRKDIGLNVGFDFYDDHLPESRRRGDETNQKFFSWLEENYNHNFFCFIHYMDVHLPYIPPEPWDKKFIGDEFYGAERKLSIVADGWGAENEMPQIGGIPRSAVLKKQGSDKDESDVRYYIAQYDSCVKYVDYLLSGVVARLKELNVFDETLIIITADHGDAMGENDVWFYHSLTVTPDQTHVPLLIKPHGAWSIKPRGIEVPVSLVDIFPTICDLMDFDYSNIDIDGSSLVSLVREEKDDAIESRTIISEIEGQIAYIDKDRIKIEPKKVDKDKLVFFYVEDLCSKHYIYSTKTLKEVNPMKFTGERYIPTLDSPEISYEHWHRYLYATQFVKDKVVLDIACGEGYGSYLLLQYAKRVVGVDISPEVIDYASSKHVNGGLEFRVGSASNIPVDGEAIFDVVVSFETIEHINEDEQKAFLSEVKRLLEPDGVFVVSTPNKLVYTDISDHRNEFHIKEFYVGEFKEFLGGYFKNVMLMGQRIYPISYIWDTDSRESKLIEYRLCYSEHGFRPSDEPKSIMYAIAVCSDKEIGDTNSSISVDLSEKILKLKDQHIGNLETYVKNLEAGIRDKDATLTNIYNSHGWKTLLVYYRVRDKIFPVNSRRRKAAKYIWNFFKIEKISAMLQTEKKIKFPMTRRHEHLFHMIRRIYHRLPIPNQLKWRLRERLWPVVFVLREGKGNIPDAMRDVIRGSHVIQEIDRDPKRELALIKILRYVGDNCKLLGPVEHVIALPFLGTGGAEMTALNFAKAIRALGSDHGVLLVITDRALVSGQVSLPDGVLLLVLDDFAGCDSGYVFKQKLLCDLLLALRPKVFHNINSEVAWQLILNDGERLHRLTKIFASIFAFQFAPDGVTKIGYAANFFRGGFPYLTGVLSDNHRFVEDAIDEYSVIDGRERLIAIYAPSRIQNKGWAERARNRISARKVRGHVQRPRVLWAGRLDADKRVDLFLEVVKCCPFADFEVFGQVVVDGSMPLETLPNLVFRGPFLHPEDIVAHGDFDAFVFTSKWEGMPNILLEIGSLGIPIVAPVVGGVGELITEDTGYPLAECPEADNYAEALKCIWHNPADAAARAECLVALIDRRHNWDRFLANVASLPGYIYSSVNYSEGRI